jgi:ABC-type multidrug transport system fused ATPase/permease subunit
MHGRTVILISHHVQLCVPGAEYIVVLDNGRLQFEGDRNTFQSSAVMQSLVQSTDTADSKEEVVEVLEETLIAKESASDSSSTTASLTPDMKIERKPARRLVEEEKRAVGLIGRDIWETYIRACGNGWYWTVFIVFLLLVAISPVLENGWLKYVPRTFCFLLQLMSDTRYWASSSADDDQENPSFYITIYAAITITGLVIGTIRFLILYNGSIRASTVLYKGMLEAILFANIRFHDTVSRGRLLNRFGKDFEGRFSITPCLFSVYVSSQGIDSSLADNFGRSIGHALSAATTIITISIVGGYRFVIAVCILGLVYYQSMSIFCSAKNQP